MRDIRVSVDVFARIWALRKAGETTEDEILRRLLGVVPQPPGPAKFDPQAAPTGFFDARHDVRFAEGFEIFRYYKGKFFAAKATNGAWLLRTGERFKSLNELSRYVVRGSENAWVNWSFRDASGRAKRISELRDEGKLSRRKRTDEPSVTTSSSASKD